MLNFATVHSVADLTQTGPATPWSSAIILCQKYPKYVALFWNFKDSWILVVAEFPVFFRKGVLRLVNQFICSFNISISHRAAER